MKQQTSTSSYLLRLLGGGYLVYLGLTLIEGMMQAEGGLKLIELICILLFCSVGTVLCFVSFKRLRQIQLLGEENEETCIKKE